MPASVAIPDRSRAFQAARDAGSGRSTRRPGGKEIGTGHRVTAAGAPSGAAGEAYELVGTMDIAGRVRAILRLGSRQYLVEPGSRLQGPDLPGVRVQTIARDRLVIEDIDTGVLTTRRFRSRL